MKKEGRGIENINHGRDRNREIIDGLRDNLFRTIHRGCRERLLNPNRPAELFRNQPRKGRSAGFSDLPVIGP